MVKTQRKLTFFLPSVEEKIWQDLKFIFCSLYVHTSECLIHKYTLDYSVMYCTFCFLQKEYFLFFYSVLSIFNLMLACEPFVI
jgi:hypothetical protein